ncbi:uncharacterized protein LOC134202933 [Armigeres subalbatus]|uniref:uncharacterized protein LOC134202933 n=1 Tax=Armigeres subalbatus TaxID=124917 RepID=UPI002ED4F5BB
MAALHKAAEAFEVKYPEAAERIKRHTYVDDPTSGADSVEKAKRIIKQINEILGAAGFTLRKWSSNSAEVLESLSDINNNSMAIQFPDERNTVKALGTHWVPGEDVFTFKVTMANDGPNTKHQLLSDSAKLFDPFGWFAPVIVRVKILYQRCWLYDLNWHDALPPVIEEAWMEVKENLHQLEQIKIPRWAANYNGRIELHGFSDASEEAYAAVIYLRSVDSNGEINVTLLAAKTKVAPVRQVSIPRLELNAAELLAKLMKHVAEPFKRFHIEQYAWTDSTIVLQWLSDHPRKWNTYIANRTSSILDILPRKHWAHVSSKDNPADCASRGISPQELVSHPIWWTGPAWLYAASSNWGRDMPHDTYDEETLEVRKRFQSLNVTVSFPASNNVIEREILEKRSDLTTACWQLARVNRFVSNMKSLIGDTNKVTGPILPSELHRARMNFVRLAQQELYEGEIKALIRGDEVPAKSSISSLYPFLDGIGILRVGGRLQHSMYSYDIKHPIILSKEHRFTKLLVEEIHVNNCHAGPTLITATINQRYWIQGCQTAIKRVIRKCMTCCRQKAQAAKQLMGSLPASRVTACRPFAHVGVDYAGPIMVRCSNTRGARCMKGYIVVFVCLSRAFKRMIARRGYCSEIWSDNGTNLVGADRQLQEVYEMVTKHAKQKEHFFANLGIRWRFIPPASPHQGDIWEAVVKSAKELLRPIVGNEKLTYEELSTVLCKVEACLNSRPLGSMSSCPDRFEALTPGHFLVGQPLNSLPEPDVTHLRMNMLDRWQRVQRYTQDFWQRWRDEYIATLQPRGKWKTKEQNLNPGQLVLVKNDNCPPSAWELARIVAVHPDQQGLVRNVTLRRGKSEYQRSVQKLCPLPV